MPDGLGNVPDVEPGQPIRVVVQLAPDKDGIVTSHEGEAVHVQQGREKAIRYPFDVVSNEHERTVGAAGQPVVDALIDGIDAVLLCCGGGSPAQHASLFGSAATPGAVPWVARALFERLHALAARSAADGLRRRFDVHASFVLLHPDVPRDLLSAVPELAGGTGEKEKRYRAALAGDARPEKVRLKRGGGKGVHLAGVREMLVTNHTQLAEAIALGEESRAKAGELPGHHVLQLRLTQQLEPVRRDLPRSRPDLARSLPLSRALSSPAAPPTEPRGAVPSPGATSSPRTSLRSSRTRRSSCRRRGLGRSRPISSDLVRSRPISSDLTRAFVPQGRDERLGAGKVLGSDQSAGFGGKNTGFEAWAEREAQEAALGLQARRWPPLPAAPLASSSPLASAQQDPARGLSPSSVRA